MNFQELDALIVNSGRRSIASALIACLLDASDSGAEGLDLDIFQKQTGFVRNNVTSVAGYLQKHGLITILYYRDDVEGRVYVSENSYGRWAKQHYQLTLPLKKLFRRN
ncbi:hypothetical protein [Citrobacter sp. RHB35-C17]|uniref:hypothetical protein n=1 Tax=Citrobacter sp. RHB35-C17 TaxID=2742625 RepID=UPI0015EAC6B7|nr:hypothetical protein [Citrobacter sp. RHB35-C17]QMD64610.1 hypothetical protein HVZ37_22625 [Citrobacter sp. RHB35-C17]HBL7007447.1 hypothetical protein [Citrobacter koseri]